MSCVLATYIALLHIGHYSEPALSTTTVPKSEDTLPTTVIICKSRKQQPLALLSPWFLDSLCSNLSRVRASDTSGADLVNSVSYQVRDTW
ncbi:unnamed protein product [Staurois parvus]|uniref:Secreted protein n=1 Tax=Staurois parvus TaxID=386267 RepID=A0ABN9B5K6_9NEOB|nr:unnamed protein product [Staurois parvus]